MVEAVAEGVADDGTLFVPGAAFVLAEGEAKESRPGPSFVDAVAVPAGGDAVSVPSRFTAIAVTQAATVAMASPPASQSLRVPGARDGSGAQPCSQGWFRGGWGEVSCMRCSSSGARGGGRGCEGEVSER